MSEKTVEKNANEPTEVDTQKESIRYLFSYPGNEEGIEIQSSLNVATLKVIMACNPMSKALQEDTTDIRQKLDFMFAAKEEEHSADDLKVTLDNPSESGASYTVSLAGLRRILDLVADFDVHSYRE